MRLEYILVMLMLAAAFVSAETLSTNTSVTVDWIGGDQFYLRTESGDFLFNATDQTDRGYQLNFTREYSTVNITNISSFLTKIDNLSQIVADFSTTYNYSMMYADEKAAHERLIIYQDECDAGFAVCREQRDNLTMPDGTGLYDKCKVDLAAFIDQYNACNRHTNNITGEFENYKVKTKNDGTNGFLLGAGIAAIIAYFLTENKRKKQVPDEMSDAD